VDPGDTVTIGSQELTVRGAAMTTSTQRYPLEQPALVWVDAATGARLAAAGGGFEWLELRLDDPSSAAAFADRLADGLPPNLWELHHWQERRDEEEAGSPLNDLSAALLLAGSLLAVLTTATAAVLVAGRLAAQTRQIGTLKAVGVTPGQVTAVLLVESLTMATIATGVGLLVGRALAPVLARSVVTLYGGPRAPAITPTRTLLIAGVAVTLVTLATVRPSLRALRQSTLRALAANVHAPGRATAGRLGQRLRLPLHAVLAVRTLRRRPGRLAINVTTLTLAVAMVVLGLSIHRSWRQLPSTPDWASDDAVARAADQDLYNELLTVVVAAAALLALLAAINTVIVATFAARDNARNHAILRALGATPRQTQTAFLLAQLVACVLACGLGIPLGIVLFHAWGGDLAEIELATPTLAAVAAATTLLCLIAAGVPSQLLANRPVTRTLTYE
jgi:putative ABC transport system permease protein